MPNLMHDTDTHIDKVQARMAVVLHELRHRADVHDASKYDPAERPGYEIIGAVLAGRVYGTPEYNAAMAEARQRPEVSGAIEHHYAHNPHHPEAHAAGVAGMSLLDVVEMLADWKAASERSGGRLSLAFNIERFGIDPQLAAILENTVRELGW